MESKDDPPTEVVCKNFMAELVDYCQSASFQAKIDAFMESNKSHFVRSNHSCKSFISLDHEQSLDQTKAFDEFQVLIDSLFDKFADNYNISPDLLFANCRDAVEGRFMPLFQEDENKWFIEEILLNWMNYESFSKMMRKYASECDEKPEAGATGGADMKEQGSSSSSRK